MKLYENIVIGNFLYALGFSVRSKITNNMQPAMVNLLQQTPVDESLSDVLVRFPGTTRLIEFKQKSNKSNKERDKHRVIQRYLEIEQRLQPISRSIHWFIETSPLGDDFESTIIPYLDAFPRPESLFNFWDFIDITASEAVQEKSEFSEDEIREYLNFIRDVSGSDYVGTGGLLVHINSEGKIVYSQLADMIQMRLNHKEYVHDMEKSYEHAHQKILSQHKRHERTKSRGLER